MKTAAKIHQRRKRNMRILRSFTLSFQNVWSGFQLFLLIKFFSIANASNVKDSGTYYSYPDILLMVGRYLKLRNFKKSDNSVLILITMHVYARTKIPTDIIINLKVSLFEGFVTD